MTTTPPFDQETIRAKARELHDPTDGTGYECGGKVPLEGDLCSAPWWQRGWYGLATAAIIEDHHFAHGKSPLRPMAQTRYAVRPRDSSPKPSAAREPPAPRPTLPFPTSSTPSSRRASCDGPPRASWRLTSDLRRWSLRRSG
jgi:hypothetical protein